MGADVGGYEPADTGANGTVSRDMDEKTTEIVEIASTLSRMRLLIKRRIIGRMAMKKMATELDFSHFDVIEAVKRIGAEGEVTVGAIAEAMRIDPSRSSRLVAELVQLGMLERAVSQADARRSVVVLTEMAVAHFREAGAVKLRLIADIVSGWSEEEVSAFSGLFLRFVDEFETLGKAVDG